MTKTAYYDGTGPVLNQTIVTPGLTEEEKSRLRLKTSIAAIYAIAGVFIDPALINWLIDFLPFPVLKGIGYWDIFVALIVFSLVRCGIRGSYAKAALQYSEAAK